MRVLLDESLPRPLAKLLVRHEVRTVVEVAWASVENGELLRRASGAFDVLITSPLARRRRRFPCFDGVRSLAANRHARERIRFIVI